MGGHCMAAFNIKCDELAFIWPTYPITFVQIIKGSLFGSEIALNMNCAELFQFCVKPILHFDWFSCYLQVCAGHLFGQSCKQGQEKSNFDQRKLTPGDQFDR